MDPADFSNEVQERVKQEPDKDKKYELLRAAQEERGNAWDEVFRTFGASQFAKCGLTKEFNDPRYPHSLGLLIKKALELSLAG